MVEISNISIRGLSKKLGERQVLSDVNMDIPGNRITCLMAPSGWGKTTLLNIIAGLTPPDTGSVTGLEGKSIAYAFQEPRLLPWKSVRGNIEFAIKGKFPKDECERRIGKWLKAVHLEESANLLPAQLSGGMAQRTALARALALEADVVLLDEPFNGIDESLKDGIIHSLKDIWKSKGTTVIMVTHNGDEARGIADSTLLPEDFFDFLKKSLHT